jgi:CRP-like cAMP-binding protein
LLSAEVTPEALCSRNWIWLQSDKSSMDNGALLRRHPILARAGEKALATLGRNSVFREHAANQHLVRPGDVFRGPFVLGQGAVAVTRKNLEAKTRMLIGTMQSPGLIGDAELFGGVTKWEVSIRATSPVQLVQIPGEVFISWIAPQPEVLLGLYQDAAARLQLCLELMQVLTLQKMENKILRLLWTSSTREGPESLRVAPLVPTLLASALGVSVRTVARNLNILEKKGLIQRRNKSILLRVTEQEAFGGRLEKRPLAAKWLLPVKWAGD